MSIKLKPLNQQILVVTGASSGIGLAIACEATKSGASVLLVSRNADELERVAGELRAGEGRVSVCSADVANPADVERVAQTAITEFGGFDTWVNDASVSVYGAMEDISWEDHRRVLEVNYFGLLKGSLVAAKHLRERGGGAIINLGSILSDRTIIFQGPYCAAKHAVLAATDALRMELERDGAGISVTLIKPAAMHTPFPEHARNYMDEPAALPPVIYDPRLVAEAVLFAAENPRRTLYVGGAGYVQSVLGRIFPRLTDKIMEAVMVRGQQSPGDPPDPARHDNLYQPRAEAVIEGGQHNPVRRQSLFLQAQKHPGIAAAAFGGAALAALAVFSPHARSAAQRGRHAIRT